MVTGDREGGCHETIFPEGRGSPGGSGAAARAGAAGTGARPEPRGRHRAGARGEHGPARDGAGREDGGGRAARGEGAEWLLAHGERRPRREPEQGRGPHGRPLAETKRHAAALHGRQERGAHRRGRARHGHRLAHDGARARRAQVQRHQGVFRRARGAENHRGRPGERRQLPGAPHERPAALRGGLQGAHRRAARLRRALRRAPDAHQGAKQLRGGSRDAAQPPEHRPQRAADAHGRFRLRHLRHQPLRLHRLRAAQPQGSPRGPLYAPAEGARGQGGEGGAAPVGQSLRGHGTQPELRAGGPRQPQLERRRRRELEPL